MTDRDTLGEDIAYVRDATSRASGATIRRSMFCGRQSGRAASRWSISLMIPGGSGDSGCWQVPAALPTLCGSGFRAQRRVGQADRRSGIRWGLQWLEFLVAGILGVALVATGHLDWAGFGSLVVLLLSLTYFHAGLQLDPRLLPIAVVAAA